MVTTDGKLRMDIDKTLEKIVPTFPCFNVIPAKITKKLLSLVLPD